MLFSQISPIRHDQVLQELAGVTAMQPVPICVQTLYYEQLRAEEAASQKKQPHNGSQKARQVQKLFRHIVNGEGQPWTVRTEDVPQAGVKDMISRPVDESAATHADLEKFREGGSWYKYITQSILLGHRFVHNNLVIRIARILTVPEGTGALEPLDAPLPNLDECRLLDMSGAYLCEVSVRVADPNNSMVTDAAKKELMEFKAIMDGAVDLKVPGNRLSMDPRAKNAS